MRHAPRLVLAVAGLAIALAAAPGQGHVSVCEVFPSALAQEKPDLTAEWDKQWKKALDDAAKEYEKLFKFCVDKSIEATGLLAKRRILKYRPDDEETRKFLGYMKTPDGKYVLNEDRKDQLKEMVDIDDPKATDYSKKELGLQKKIRDAFKGLAKKAAANGAAEPAKLAEWKQKESRAWERVLEVDYLNEEAHKALNHPKFEGKYCTPFALEFLKVRAERKKGGLARAQTDFGPFQTAPVDGPMAAAGIAGGAAKSPHTYVAMQHGPDNAMTAAKWGERAIEDFIQIHGMEPSFKEQVGLQIYMGKESGDWEKMLRSAGFSEAEIKRYKEARFSGVGTRSGYVCHNSGSDDANDLVMSLLSRGCARVVAQMYQAEYGGAGAMEDWLEDAIGYDTTRRLTGTTLTVYGEFGKYGNNVTPRVNSDIWMELARLQVDLDDDVPLERIWKKKRDAQQIKGPDIVKGYAFVQFIFEKDATKAREWVKRALVQGTPAATEAVYQMPMEQLDAEYREWILKTW